MNDQQVYITITHINEFSGYELFRPGMRVILKKDTPYETEEGCLSLDGVRKTTRYQNIEVEYLDSSWNRHRQKFSG